MSSDDDDAMGGAGSAAAEADSVVVVPAGANPMSVEPASPSVTPTTDAEPRPPHRRKQGKGLEVTVHAAHSPHDQPSAAQQAQATAQAGRINNIRALPSFGNLRAGLAVARRKRAQARLALLRSAVASGVVTK